MTTLPLALPALVVAVHGLSARLLPPPRGAHDRVCATALLAPVAAVALVVVLGALHAIAPAWVLAGTLALAGALWGGCGARARATALGDARRAVGVLREALTGLGGLGLLAGLCALVLAAWAAWLLPPWSWDGLGYHLPVVYDALQEHRLRVVPTGVVFVNAYPHAGEWFTAWWRALLDDDTWVDFAQAPFALAVVAVAAALARRHGAAAPRALGWCALFLPLPVVLLQLASNYIDVMYAAALLLAVYFATAQLAAAETALAGVAIGFALALKPSAPPAAALLTLVLLVRAWRARAPVWSVALALAAVAFGAEPYLANAVVHHNPVWPVEMRVGPLALPGLAPASEYINHGLPEWFLRRGWLGRLVGSWYALPPRYVYDMRLGGLGPLLPLGLVPLALWAAARGGPRVRAMLPTVALAAVCALASPGAFLSRYTLALPAALLALAAVLAEELRTRPRAALQLAFTALACVGLWRASPGLTDGGPSLPAVARMAPEERARAVSADGHAGEWAQARALVGEGDAFGFDGTLELSGLLWRPDGRGRVVYLDGDAARTDAAVREWVARERVRVAALADEGGGAVAARHPEWFAPWFRCPFEPCTVYRVVAPSVH